LRGIQFGDLKLGRDIPQDSKSEGMSLSLSATRGTMGNGFRQVFRKEPSKLYQVISVASFKTAER
jgi:hypothetical protein